MLEAGLDGATSRKGQPAWRVLYGHRSLADVAGPRIGAPSEALGIPAAATLHVADRGHACAAARAVTESGP